MSEKYRRKAISDVDATQFTGGEESAAAVIAWASTVNDTLEIHRYMHDGSWNDRHPELWLEVHGSGWKGWVSPGCWIIVDPAGPEIEVLSNDQFLEDYEIAEVTA